MNVTDFVGNGAGAGGLKITGSGIFNSSAGVASQGVGVTRATAINTYGSWSQLLAATTEDDYLLGICVVHSLLTFQGRTIGIGTGGAGSEVQIAELKIGSAPIGVGPDGTTYTAGPGVIWLPYPMLITSGTRIAARWAGDSGNSSQSINISALLCKKTDLVSQ